MKYNIKRGTSYPFCPICGKNDYCFVVVNDDGAEFFYCGRVHQDSVPGFIALKKQSAKGQFVAYQSEEQLAAWKAAKKEEWLSSQGINRSYVSKKPYVNRERFLGNVHSIKKEPCRELTAQKKDEMYRYFLSLLVLEPYHEQALREEWACANWGDLAETLFNIWPIKSLPPYDYVRRGGLYSDVVTNCYRTEIAEKMASKFGDLEGLYGFFKNKSGQWDISGQEGILFPCFDLYGRITGLRIKADYPDYKGNFLNFPGTYFHKYINGEHCWFFQQSSEIYGNEYAPFKVSGSGVNMVELTNTRPQHPYGKAANKYIIFSSYHGEEKMVNGEKIIVNSYTKGAQCGLKYSFYYKPGDDTTKVIFTEGEKKGMVANAFFGVLVVHVPGVQNYDMLFEPDVEYGGVSFIEALVENGVKDFYVAYDADKVENEIVLRSEQGLMQRLKPYGSVYELSWVDDYNTRGTKGLDDLCVAGGSPVVYEQV